MVTAQQKERRTEWVGRETLRCLCSLGVRQHGSHGLVVVLQGPHAMKEDTKHVPSVMSQCSRGYWLSSSSPQQSKACCSSIFVLPSLFLSPEPGGCHTRLYHSSHHARKAARLSAATLTALHSTGAKHTAPMQSMPAAEGCKAVLAKFPSGTQSEGIVVLKALRSAVLQEVVRLPPPTVFCSSCWQAAAHSPVPNRSGQKGIFQSQEGCQRMPTPPPLIARFAEPHTRLPRARLAGTFLPPQSALCSRSALTAQLSVNKRALRQDARRHSAASLPRRVEIASFGRKAAFAVLWGAKRCTPRIQNRGMHGTASQQSTAPARVPAPKGPYQ